MGRHPLRAAQPRGVSQICSGTHRPCPGDAPLAFSLRVSSWLHLAQVTVRLQQEQFYRGQRKKELPGTSGGKPTALPMPRASQHWPGMQLLAPGGWVSLQLCPWVVSCIPLGVERTVLQHTPSLRHHGDGEGGHEIGQGKPMSQGEMGTKGETAGGEGSP